MANTLILNSSKGTYCAFLKKIVKCLIVHHFLKSAIHSINGNLTYINWSPPRTSFVIVLF